MKEVITWQSVTKGAALAVISAARSENVTEKTVLQKLNAMSTVKSTASPQK